MTVDFFRIARVADPRSICQAGAQCRIIPVDIRGNRVAWAITIAFTATRKGMVVLPTQCIRSRNHSQLMTPVCPFVLGRMDETISLCSFAGSTLLTVNVIPKFSVTQSRDAIWSAKSSVPTILNSKSKFYDSSKTTLGPKPFIKTTSYGISKC